MELKKKIVVSCLVVMGCLISFRVGTVRATNAALTAKALADVPILPIGQETLNDQVKRALAGNDGPMAAILANVLSRCKSDLEILKLVRSEGHDPYADAQLLASRVERLQEYARKIAHCQTVPGDHVKVRLGLLDLAMQQGVVGAAKESFLAGSREPSTLSRMVNDANSGDISSILNISFYEPKLFGITQEQQDAMRYALKLASTDPVVGERIAADLRIAEHYPDPDSQFDFSAISNATRKNGAEIAERIKERLRKKFF